MSEAPVAAEVDLVDPQIRIFVTEMTAGFSQFPAFDEISYPEARQIAERVRRRWREGGPAMASVRETFAATRHGDVRVRVYTPEGDSAARPGLIYLHGGGWTLFSLDTHDRVMREYAARAGVAVIGVDYALAPEVKFPVALEQIVDVVLWLGEEAAESLGVDPARLAIAGDSAGGNLSAAVCLQLRDLDRGERVRAMLLNYAALDADGASVAASPYGGEGYMLGQDEMRQFWVNYLRDPADANNPLASPAQASLAGLPPAWLTIAECDVLAEQNLAFAERLAAAGVPTTAKVYRGATHSFLEAMSISTLAARALQDGADWLRTILA